MKHLLFSLLLVFSELAFADPQINAQDGYAHWIFNAINTDYEHERKQDVGITRLDDGRANAYVKNEFTVRTQSLPENIPIINGEPRISICGNCIPDPVFAQELSEELCTMTDTNGTRYTATVWWLIIRVVQEEYGLSTLRTSMSCLGGVEVGT